MGSPAEYNKEYNQRPHVKTAKKEYKTTKKGKYHKQMERAKARGIEWLFTYDTWARWWGADWSKRGRKDGDLVMGRIGDVGPYSPENCIKLKHGENLRANNGRVKEKTSTSTRKWSMCKCNEAWCVACMGDHSV